MEVFNSQYLFSQVTFLVDNGNISWWRKVNKIISMPEKLKTRQSISITSSDRKTLADAKDILSGKSKKRGFAKLLPFLGPAFIASVAYVDPGNFATNIQGGAQFGYTLLWVILASNLMAMLIQTLSAKLGIATGRNLAELCRENFPGSLYKNHVGDYGTGGNSYRPGRIPGCRARISTCCWEFLSGWLEY